MTLREARCAFSRKLADLITWAFGQGYEIALDEGRVYSRRKVRKDGKTFFADDAVHMAGSLHYEGLAADLSLYINGEWISDGGHPAWTRIGMRWESYGLESDLPLSWGGRFNDSNHFSLSRGGRK